MRVKMFSVPLIDTPCVCVLAHSDGHTHGWTHPAEAKWTATSWLRFDFAAGTSPWLFQLAQAFCLLGIPTSLASLDPGTESCLNANYFLRGRDIIIHLYLDFNEFISLEESFGDGSQRDMF